MKTLSHLLCLFASAAMPAAAHPGHGALMHAHGGSLLDAWPVIVVALVLLAASLRFSSKRA
jgi:hypothetical protein